MDLKPLIKEQRIGEGQDGFVHIHYFWCQRSLHGGGHGGMGPVQAGLRGIIAFGILSFLVSSHLLLFELVLQSVLYFVCQSYHCENTDKAALSDLLEICQGKCEPLKTKLDFQQDQSPCVIASDETSYLSK